MAGWDKVEGGSVFAIPLGGTLVQVPFTIGGSGSAYIYGLCDKLWRVGEGEGEGAVFVGGMTMQCLTGCGNGSWEQAP